MNNQMFRSNGSTTMSANHVGVGSTLSIGQKDEWLIFAGEGSRKVAALNLKNMVVATSFVPVEDVHYLSKDETEELMRQLGNYSFTDFHISAQGLKRA